MAKNALGISTKIISLVLIISVVSIAVTTGLAFNLIDSVLKAQTQKTLEDESFERGTAIAKIIESRMDSVKSLSENQVIQDVVFSLPSGLDDVSFDRIMSQEKENIQNEISNFQLNEFQAGLHDLKIVNMRGKLIYSLNSQELGPNTSQIRLDSDKIEFFSGPDKSRLMKISIPIKTPSGTQQGAVIATTPTPVFDNILSSRFNLQETGEVYLVNSNRVMISDSIFIQDAKFKQRVNTLPVTACFENNQSISGTVYEDYRGVEIFGVSVCKKDLGFVLLTEVDESVVLQPIFDLQEKLIMAGLAIMLIAGIVSFILSRRLSKPILLLRDSADKVSKGKFVETKIKTNDEIGQLSESFDMMVRNLRETLSAIDRREGIIRKQEDLLLRVSESEKVCCVCLIDMVGAKKIVSSLSKEKQEKYNQVFLDSILPIIKKYNGTSVKMVNDELLCYFNTEDEPSQIDKVIECCLEICEFEPEINKILSAEGLPGMSYRVSSTFGTVNETKSDSGQSDVFGEPVNHCFRINQYALPNSLVIGNDLYEKLDKEKYSFTNLSKSILEGLDYNLFIVKKKKN